MPTAREVNIFKKGSKTYFYSSIFFPQKIKNDVFTLYSFVRTADDLVDSVPQKIEEFERFKKETHQAFSIGTSENAIINRFVILCERTRIKKEWVVAFLAAMEADTYKHVYRTLQELEIYIYGSAEVIGLMMAQILGLPEPSHPYAGLQGKAMQMINFIRDIQEDNQLNRLYIPYEEIKEYGFSNLKKNEIMAKKDTFALLVNNQIERYILWQNEAEKGYQYIPKRYLIPIKTAADMYKWTAKEILKDPFIIFNRKVKPQKSRILFTVVKNFFIL